MTIIGNGSIHFALQWEMHFLSRKYWICGLLLIWGPIPEVNQWRLHEYVERLLCLVPRAVMDKIIAEMIQFLGAISRIMIWRNVWPTRKWVIATGRRMTG
jgi:hypothetical protein